VNEEALAQWDVLREKQTKTGGRKRLAGPSFVDTMMTMMTMMMMIMIVIMATT
jgi:hypothetical protein